VAPDGRSRVSGVVLAGGASRRLGGGLPKQLREWHGEPLVRRVARRALASRLDEVLVVVGHRGDEVRDALHGLAVRIVDNPRHAEGQSTSVVAGLAALAAHRDGAIFIPADMPHLDAALLDRLIAVWEATAAPIVLPSHRGRRGAPVLFDRRLFDELARIRGDEGGRQLFPAHEEEIVEVPIASKEALQDVDTAHDLTGAGEG